MDDHSFMYGPKTVDHDERRPIKFRIPEGQWVRLHFHRVTTGAAISDTVAKALDAYLTKGVQDRAAAQSTSP